jgi:hypothetical protein
VDLSALDAADQVLYKGVVEERQYRVRCPRCGTVNVITVVVGDDAHSEEEGDG